MGPPVNPGLPYHWPTVKRMQRAVAYAGAANSLNPHEIVRSVVHSLAPRFNLTENVQNAWRVPDASNGADCQSMVRFVRKVVSMVNVPGTFEHRNIYAIETAPTIAIEDDPNGWPCCGLNTSPRLNPQNPNWALSLVTDGGCNAFEATVKFTYCNETRFYPAGTTRVYGQKDDVLYVFDTMSWVVSDDFPGCTAAPVPDVFEYVPAPADANVPSCP